jgi:hypothetical protein
MGTGQRKSRAKVRLVGRVAALVHAGRRHPLGTHGIAVDDDEIGIVSARVVQVVLMKPAGERKNIRHSDHFLGKKSRADGDDASRSTILVLPTNSGEHGQPPVDHRYAVNKRRQIHR